MNLRMNIFAKYNETIDVGKLNKEQIERLREIIRIAVVDCEIAEQEKGNIDELYAHSGHTPENFRRLKTDIFRQAVRQAMADKAVDGEEPKSLNTVIGQLDISREAEAWAANEIKYFQDMTAIGSGSGMRPQNPVSLNMEENEVCYVSLIATLVERRPKAPTFPGTPAGPNDPIIKAPHGGVPRGLPQSTTDLAIVCEGYFIVTNKRLAFSGNRRVLRTPIEKLLNLQFSDDGLDYSSAQWRDPVMLKFSRPEDVERCGVVVSRVLNKRT